MRGPATLHSLSADAKPRVWRRVVDDLNPLHSARQSLEV
jgi:hypothetical protein